MGREREAVVCGEQFIRVPTALWDDAQLTGSEKLAMIALLRHFNREQQRSWPSQKLIAVETGLSEKWIRGILCKLEEKKYITILKGNGRGNVNQYVIKSFDKTGTEFLLYGDKGGTQFQKKGNSVPERGNSVPKKGNSVPTNQIKNQNKNQNKKPECTHARAYDSWVANQIAYIRTVVAAPRPGRLPELLALWRKTYGQRTVEETIRKALRWMQTKGRHYTDMERFIGNWLAGDAESPRTLRRTGQSVPDYGEEPPDWNEILPR